MIVKRFIIMDNFPKGTHSNIWDKQKQHNQGIGDELWLGEVVAMLNEGVSIAEENQRLIKMLDNVANYMQKQHKDMPIDDFVEWWNNIATEGLEND